MPNSLELNVSPAQLHTFANHPFHVRKDMEMNELVDSIRESGVIVPLIVRSRPEGGYEIISGHRRCEACRELGIEKVPVRVQELTDDEATILMVNSNIQREHVLPSEKAFAYRMKLEAIKHQGRATSGQVGPKLAQRSNIIVATQNGESVKQIQRYIRLTYLISPILQMVDESRMAFNPAVEISYMTPEHQRWLQAEFIRTYIFSFEDSFRVSVLSKYIKQAPPNPELYSLFTDIYRSTDYGFGVFDNIPYRFVVISNIHAIVKHRDIAFESMLVKIANSINFCLLSQICFVFDNSNLQHIRTFPMGFAFFLFCHHSTKCDKQCQKDFQEHLCIFSVTARGASAKADAPLCVSCAFCKLAVYLPLPFRRGMVSVFVSLQTVQV